MSSSGTSFETITGSPFFQFAGVDILYFCEFEDQEYQKFWTRGSRTGSQQQAGIGTNTYIDAEGKYKK